MRPGAGFHPTVALPLETRFPVGEALFAHCHTGKAGVGALEVTGATRALLDLDISSLLSGEGGLVEAPVVLHVAVCGLLSAD